MKRRTFLQASGAAAATLAAPQVNAQTARAKTLRVVPLTALFSLDTVFNTSLVTTNHGFAVYDTLFGLNNKREISPVYHSSHWDEPNVLAHLRLSDRKLPGGKKALVLGLGKGGSVGDGLCGGLCASRTLLRTTLLLCVLWMASLFVLYGISFDTGHMYGEGLAQSVMIAGPLIQWPMLLATTHQLERAGRLPPTRWLFGLASLSCLGLATRVCLQVDTAVGH